MLLSNNELYYLLEDVYIIDKINFFKPIFQKSEFNVIKFERLIIQRTTYDCNSIKNVKREEWVFVKKI